MVDALLTVFCKYEKILVSTIYSMSDNSACG
jgi:hypothetical protein